MSVVARRLSACLPQEVLRRSSPTAHDFVSQISQLDAACPPPNAEGKGYAVQLETSTPPPNGQNLGNSVGRRLSLDVTWLSTQVLHAERRRDSLRSPACHPEPASPAPEFLLRPSVLQRAASSSPGQRFLGRTWSLDGERGEGGSQAASPAVHESLSPYHKELLPSCPTRQQRRQSWGPAVFSPSPISTSPARAGHSVHRQDLLSLCTPGQQRRQSLGPAVISPSPESGRCFQISLDAGTPSPKLNASPRLLSPHYRVTPLPTLPMKPLRSPWHGKDSEEDEEDRPSRSSVESAADAERCGTTLSCSSNMVPHVAIHSAMPEILNNRSLEAQLTCSHGSHNEELQPHQAEEFFRVSGQRGPAGLTANSRRRASWHTTLAACKTCVSSSHCHRRHHVESAAAGTACWCPELPPCPHSTRPGSILGKGGFGVVKLGRYRGCGVAVKVLKGRRAAASSGREAKVLPLAPHTHLAWTLAVVTHAAKGHARVSWAHAFGREEEMVSQQTVTAMFSLPLEDTQGCRGGEQQRQQQGEDGAPWWAWVVSELCLPHTLLTLINDTSLTFTSEMRVRYILEVSRGLAHLHAHGLAHRDIKPGNVLLTHSGHLKIADFGCCARLDVQDDDTVLGTVRYQAPEVLRGEVGGSHSDVFSLGVTTWHLLTRILPYQGLHPHIVIYQVAYLNHRPPDHQPHTGPRTFLDAVLWRLAHTCWSEEHALRPTAAALCRNLTLLYLASSPRGVSNQQNIEVCHGDSPFPPVTPPPPHPPSTSPSIL